MALKYVEIKKMRPIPALVAFQVVPPKRLDTLLISFRFNILAHLGWLLAMPE
jgi:hypothetical protein